MVMTSRRGAGAIAWLSLWFTALSQGAVSGHTIKQTFHASVNMERAFYLSLLLAAVATPSAMATQKVAASERKPA